MGLLKGESGRASAVVGFSDDELITLQMDGEDIVATGEADLGNIQGVHFEKHPKMRKYLEDPAYIFLKFTPGWWRYTDYNTKPTTILTQEE